MINIFNILKILNNVFIPVTPGTSDADNDINNNSGVEGFYELFSEFLEKYKGLVAGVFGLLVIALVILLIYLSIVLGNNSNNPEERKRSIARILACLVVIAIFGSITLFFGLFWSAFK